MERRRRPLCRDPSPRCGALALHLDAEGKLVVLHSADAVTSNYQTALTLALYGMFRNADGDLALTRR